MGFKKTIVVFFITVTTGTSVHAQFRLPQIDIEAKGGLAELDAGSVENVDHVRTFNGQAGVHVQFNQHFAIGGFYTRSFNGETKYSNNNGNGNSNGINGEKYSAQLLMTGVDLRVSAGRSVKWRPYFSLSYAKVEFVQNSGDFNFAASTGAWGVNGGVMLRLGNNLYWNVVEVGAKFLASRIFWLKSDLIVEAKTGFTYNIRIKNK